MNICPSAAPNDNSVGAINSRACPLYQGGRLGEDGDDNNSSNNGTGVSHLRHNTLTNNACFALDYSPQLPATGRMLPFYTLTPAAHQFRPSQQLCHSQFAAPHVIPPSLPPSPYHVFNGRSPVYYPTAASDTNSHCGHRRHFRRRVAQHNHNQRQSQQQNKCLIRVTSPTYPCGNKERSLSNSVNHLNTPACEMAFYSRDNSHEWFMGSNKPNKSPMDDSHRMVDLTKSAPTIKLSIIDEPLSYSENAQSVDGGAHRTHSSNEPLLSKQKSSNCSLVQQDLAVCHSSVSTPQVRLADVCLGCGGAQCRRGNMCPLEQDRSGQSIRRCLSTHSAIQTAVELANSSGKFARSPISVLAPCRGEYFGSGRIGVGFNGH